MSLRQGEYPGAIPGSRSILVESRLLRVESGDSSLSTLISQTLNQCTGRAPACAVEPPNLNVRGAAPRRPAILIPGVVADKQCTCPASKVMWERYPPTPPIFILRGTRLKHREKPHKLLQVGAIPTPATTPGG